MHCLIIPEFMMEEIAQKKEPHEKGIFTAALNDIHNFVAGINVLKTPSGFNLEHKSGRNCNTHDCENSYDVPGKLVLTDKDSEHKVADVKKAHAGAKFTYDFFKEVFGRKSLDDKDISLNSNCRYGVNYCNAFYDGANNMTYGEGDGEIFMSFVITDVIGHEFSHGVIQNTANLEYRKMPGALNEHYADVFGSMIKQYSLGQKAKDADWLIGAGIWGPSVSGKSLRDMMHPGQAYVDDEIVGSDPQPDHMSGYDPNMTADAGGVHIFSGIPNRIFANVASQLEEESWKCAGRIWWNTLTKRLHKTSQFQDAVNGWTAEAGELFGRHSKEQKIVIDCCKMVGLKPVV